MPLVAQEEDLPQAPVVRGLSFRGNRAISDEVLRGSIATSRSSWWERSPLVRWLPFGQKRYLNETDLRRDVQRIQVLYRISGFIEASVDTLVRRSDGDVDITFLIHEGRPVRLTSLRVTGIEGIVDERGLLDRLPLGVGDPFNRLAYLASVDTIQGALRDLGYPFAEVFRNLDEFKERFTATAAFNVVPGPRVTIGSIEVYGTEQIDEGIVRRMLDVRPGAVYSARAIRRSQRDLYRMDMFSSVDIGLTDSLPSGPDDSTVTLRVQVAEAPLRRVRLGAGYGTIDCFRAANQWTVHDFLGGARTVTFNARLSHIGVGDDDVTGAGFESSGICPQLDGEPAERLRLNYNVSLSLREPLFFSRRTSATLSLFGERHTELNAFRRDAVGGDIAVTRQTPWDIPLTLTYSLSWGRTLADDVTFCSLLDVCNRTDIDALQRSRRRSTISLAAVRDRADSPVNPTRGTRLVMEARWASTTIGSDEFVQFTKGQIELASYHRLAPGAVFAWRIRAGAILSPELGIQAQRIEFVPPEERFYAGGPNTVRGFTQNELGPIVRVIDRWQVDTTEAGLDSVPDIRSSPTGGNDLLIGNAELRFPFPGLGERFSAALFVDAGQVFDRTTGPVDLSRIRVTPGFGFRVASPLGPVRLDVGFNPHEPEKSRLFDGTGDTLIELPGVAPPVKFINRFRIHFSVGQAF